MPILERTRASHSKKNITSVWIFYYIYSNQQQMMASVPPPQHFGELEKYVLGLLTDESLHFKVPSPLPAEHQQSSMDTPLPLHVQSPEVFSMQPKRRLISATPVNLMETQTDIRPPSVHMLPLLDGDPQEDVMAFLQLLRRSYPDEGDSNAYYREQIVFHRDM